MGFFRSVASLLAAITAPVPRADRATAQEQLLADLDRHVAEAMREWQVPGLALAIVRDGEVIHLRGYGTRTAGAAEPVDERTLFGIGSTTKAFTAAAVAMLVTDGRVGWDDPVARHVPGLQFYTPELTREITLRDLLSHRTGLAGGDLLWLASGYERDEVLRRVRFLPPLWPLRTHFQYGNLTYLVAGAAVESASGRPWGEFVERRIFDPLGMTSSTTGVAALAGAANVASPHGIVDGAVRVVPRRDLENVAPAGAIYSSAADMARWVRFLLDGGAVDGRVLIDPAAMEAMHTPQIRVPRDASWRLLAPDSRTIHHGMGWYLRTHRRRQVVEHSGWIDGMSAAVALVPGERLGVVVLANVTGTPLTRTLVNRVLDLQLTLRSRDWDTRLLPAYRQSLQRQQAESDRARRAAAVDEAPEPGRYAGTFADSLYGELRVTERNGRLTVRLGRGAEGDLTHQEGETFRVRWRDHLLGAGTVTFQRDGRPAPRGVELRVGGGAVSFGNVRTRGEEGAARAAPGARLEQFTGVFRTRWLRRKIQVEQVAGELKLLIPGQPPYPLTPVGPTRFEVTGHSMEQRFFVAYTLENGRVAQVALELPDAGSSVVFRPVSR
jgi:CubicO group peptidase (beta-lactamase class C family)